MAQNTSDILIETIQSWGVDTIFGLPGDGINGIMEALRKRRDTIRFIQVRHEESAAFMACAHAKYTGRLGCCLATTGPGAIHLLNGLYDAKLDQAPVLALTGLTFSDLQGSDFQQEVDTSKLFEDVAVYDQALLNPDAARMLANEACRRALDHRGVSHLTIPIDYQVEEPSHTPSMHKQMGATSNVWSPPRPLPLEQDINAAAELLNAGKKVAILVGQGALAARGEVLEIADRLAAPIVKALLGKAVVPDDHPLTTGGLGLLGTTPSQDAMEECDTLLIVGSSFPYSEFLPKDGQARTVQIDIKADRIGLRCPIEVGLIGDAASTLRHLIPKILRKEDRSFLEARQKQMRDWWELMKSRALRDGDGLIRPQRVAWELSQLLDEDAIVSGDSGTTTTWAARQIVMRDRQMFSCSGTLATMAPGLPYSIAAKLAFPKRQSIAFVGDGGFTMLMGEFATAVKYKLPIVVVLIKNNILGQIKWEQIVFLGNPEYGINLQPIDFAKFAEACGGQGIAVSETAQIRPALERALHTTDGPTLIEVTVDPNEAPMPAKVTMKQAAKFAEALARGQPGGSRIALTLFRDKLSDLL